MQIPVIIGRFQVPKLHLGHIYLISHALQNYEGATVLILGESLQRDERNPYTVRERILMIHDVFTRERLMIHWVNDVPGDDQKWSDAVDNILALYGDVILLHSRDSFRDYYKGKYPLLEIPELPGYSGTQLRKDSL